MEELLAKHRKEKRDLQSRITQKKKNATKKTRKGVNDECERLERELEEAHKAELDALEPKDSAHLDSAIDNLSIDDTEPRDEAASPADEHEGLSRNGGNLVTDSQEAPAGASQGRAKKPNRQKARLARRAAEQEAEAAAAALEAQNLPDLREQELSAMKTHMDKLKLQETLIRPDGHCLFSACAQSMPAKTKSKLPASGEPYKSVRRAAAEFMASHADDFAPFLEEPLDDYVKKIRDTAEWGGQLELQAISRSFDINVNVLQADGRIEKITSGTASEDNTIWLAYYRHSFGLGEHYNALQKLDQS